MPASRRSPHIADPGEPIYCPNGHKIPNDVWPVSDDNVVIVARRCGFRYPNRREGGAGSSGTCEACYALLRFPDDTRVVIEITSLEAYEMQKRGRKQAYELLGLRWTRPADVTLPPRRPNPAALK